MFVFSTPHASTMYTAVEPSTHLNSPPPRPPHTHTHPRTQHTNSHSDRAVTRLTLELTQAAALADLTITTTKHVPAYIHQLAATDGHHCIQSQSRSVPCNAAWAQHSGAFQASCSSIPRPCHGSYEWAGLEYPASSRVAPRRREDCSKTLRPSPPGWWARVRRPTVRQQRSR